MPTAPNAVTLLLPSIEQIICPELPELQKSFQVTVFTYKFQIKIAQKPGLTIFWDNFLPFF
jgi:hypothetical protein